jgi:hypothetical protein
VDEVRDKVMVVWLSSETRLWVVWMSQTQGFGCADEVRDKDIVVWMRSETRLWLWLI